MGAVFAGLGALFGGIILKAGITQVILGAIVATALSTLGQLIFAPKKPKGRNDLFEATPYTRRIVGGTTPIVIGRRKSFGIEVLRYNDSNAEGASSRQFFMIVYSVGPIAFIHDIKVFGEPNLFDLGHKVKDGIYHSSVFAYLLGSLTQEKTGFGWLNADSLANRTGVAANYATNGLTFTPDSPYPIAHKGRAGINLFLAADQSGRSQGNQIACEGIVDGILCRRFKDDSGDYLCYVDEYNQWIEFDHNDKHYTKEIVGGTYTASQLTTVVQTAFNAATDDDAAGHGITFTVTYSSGTDKFTISSDTSGVTLLTWIGAYRDQNIYDDLGILKGARYSFDPLASGGTKFDDIQLAGAGPYTYISDVTFTKSYTRNPIRILFELRTNPFFSPGLEHVDDFDHDLMLIEEKYCDEIVEVDSTTQYDISPRNVMRLIDVTVSATPNNDNITITSDALQKSGNELLKLVDGSYSQGVKLTNATEGDGIPKIRIPTLSGTNIGGGNIIIYVNHSDNQTYTIQRYDSAIEWTDLITKTNVSGNQTIPFSFFEPIQGALGIRITNFSRAGGANFAISEVQVMLASNNFARNTGNYPQLENTVIIGSGERQDLMDGNTSTDIEFGSIDAGAGVQFWFPFVRTIGRIVIATNVSEDQSYTVQYKATAAGSWTTIPSVGTQANVQGTKAITFTPISMIAFQITSFSRGDGSRPFTLTEIEAYDAIPSRRYMLDAVIESGERFNRILERLYQSCFAIPCEAAGKQSIIIDRDESTVQEINDDHISSYKRIPTPRRDKVNQWILKFVNELKGYETDTFIFDDYHAQIRSHDYPGGGTGQIISSREIELVGVTRPAQIARMGNVIRERARVSDRVHVINLIPGSLIWHIGKIIRLNLPSFRVVNQKVRLQRIELREDLSMEIEVVDHTPEVYDDVEFDISNEMNSDRLTDSSVGGSSGTAGNVEDVALVFPDIETTGTSVPQVLVTQTTPDDPNYSHSNIYVNYNDETDANGNLSWRHETTINQGDISRALILDTEGALDSDKARVTVLVQSVSVNEMSLSVDSIYTGWQNGENTAVQVLDIPLNAEDTYIDDFNQQIAYKARKGRKLYPFTGDGTSDPVTVPEYALGTTRLIVNGGEWLLNTTETSSEYWYEETDSTTITPRYPINNGAPCFLEYAPA